MLATTADDTVTPAVPDTEFIVAVMVTAPALKDCNTPPLETVATVESELCQLT